MTASALRGQPVTAEPIPFAGHPCYAMLAARTPASVIDLQYEAIGEAHRMHLGESLWLALYLLNGTLPTVLDKGAIGFPYRHGIAARDLGVTVKKIRHWMGVLVKGGYVISTKPVTIKDVFWGLLVTIDRTALWGASPDARIHGDAGPVPVGETG